MKRHESSELQQSEEKKSKISEGGFSPEEMEIFYLKFEKDEIDKVIVALKEKDHEKIDLALSKIFKVQNSEYFHFLVAEQNIEDLKLMIKLLRHKPFNTKFLIDLPDNEGKTPLHHAVELENIEIIKLLFEEGANIDIGDNKGKTPLYYGVEKNSKDIVTFLIDKGARFDLPHEVNESKIEEYKDYHKNYKNKSRKQTVPLLHLAAQSDRTEILNLLIEKGANINVKDNNSNTILHAALSNPNLVSIKILLGKGIDVNSIGKPPLLLTSDIEILDMLLNAGADININDNEGNTALHLAVKKQNIQAVNFLLDKGIQLNKQNRNRRTPLDLILIGVGKISRNQLAISEILAKAGTKVSISFGECLNYKELAEKLQTISEVYLLAINIYEVSLCMAQIIDKSKVLPKEILQEILPYIIYNFDSETKLAPNGKVAILNDAFRYHKEIQENKIQNNNALQFNAKTGLKDILLSNTQIEHTKSFVKREQDRKRQKQNMMKIGV